MPGASSSAADLTIEITRDLDVITAQIKTRRFAGAVGFPKHAQWELAIAVSEAATNILKYGVRGSIYLAFYIDNPPFLEFVARDEGAGFESVGFALQDRVSDGVDLRVAPRPGHRGLGLGLGAITRLMDDVEIASAPTGGAIVRARKRMRR